MNYHILTLFPEMVMGGLKNSIIGRAMEKELITAEAVNIRDYSADRHHHVDDYPYGGGAGMVMQPGPVVEAYEALSARIGKRPRVIYMTPQAAYSPRKSQRSWPGRRSWCFSAAITRGSTRGCWKRL